MPNYSRRGFLRSWRPYIAYCLLVFASSAFASPFDCTDTGHCGLRGEGSYPHLVVGTAEHVADDIEATKIFRWARDHGYWATLPDDVATFLQEIKIVSVAVPGLQGAGRITLLMGRTDYDAIQINPGDFVRYTPHGATSGQTPLDKMNEYWKLFGCIAVLCRAEDRACPVQYRAGIYRVKDGTQLDPNTRAEIADGIRIDPGTYRPLAQSEKVDNQQPRNANQ